MSRRWLNCFWIMCLLLLVVPPLSAQDEPPDTVRDPLDLASRLMGVQITPEDIPLPTPRYVLEDSAEFWVGKTGMMLPSRVTAKLAAVTPNIYLWVEDGLDYTPETMQPNALELDLTLSVLRTRANYPVIQSVPQTLTVFEDFSGLRLPDVDNDPHLFILFAADVAGGQSVLHNPNDSLVARAAPQGYSNQHEMLIVNTSVVGESDLASPVYRAVINRGLALMLSHYNTPDRAPWLAEMLNGFTFMQLQQTSFTGPDAAPFLQLPNTPLTSLPSMTSANQVFGAQQLFLSYFFQRVGSAAFIELFERSGAGLSALDTLLVERGVHDLVTGEPITAGDLFADFVMTNIVNRPLGDGRFVHRATPLEQGLNALGVIAEAPFDVEMFDQAVNQFGTGYLVLLTDQAADFTLTFEGQPTVARLPLPADSAPDNHFYWSGAGLNRDTTLTRAFDLRDVDSARLDFDIWYALAAAQHYVYVEVSTDNGATWQIVPVDGLNSPNPFGMAYGPGFTGISSDQPPTLFPYLGVLLGNDGITITGTLPDGPAFESEIQPNDIIIGHDGAEWEGAPDLRGWLANFQPGDEVNLYLQRGEERLDMPITLGARVVPPPPVWMSHTVDLTPFAGGEILLRFEYVSLSAGEDSGAALDNIAVEAISFYDDAESDSGWTFGGWERITNQVEQQYLVQVATIDTTATGGSVRRLIDHNNPASSGQWRFSLSANQALVVAISGLNENTVTPAPFNLLVKSEDLQ